MWHGVQQPSPLRPLAGDLTPRFLMGATPGEWPSDHLPARQTLSSTPLLLIGSGARGCGYAEQTPRRRGVTSTTALRSDSRDVAVVPVLQPVNEGPFVTGTGVTLTTAFHRPPDDSSIAPWVIVGTLVAPIWLVVGGCAIPLLAEVIQVVWCPIPAGPAMGPIGESFSVCLDPMSETSTFRLYGAAALAWWLGIPCGIAGAATPTSKWVTWVFGTIALWHALLACILLTYWLVTPK